MGIVFKWVVVLLKCRSICHHPRPAYFADARWIPPTDCCNNCCWNAGSACFQLKSTCCLNRIAMLACCVEVASFQHGMVTSLLLPAPRSGVAVG